MKLTELWLVHKVIEKTLSIRDLRIRSPERWTRQRQEERRVDVAGSEARWGGETQSEHQGFRSSSMTYP